MSTTARIESAPESTNTLDEPLATMKHLVVIPAFNEEESLPRTIGKLQSLSADFELVVINDGSSDRTGELAHELAATSGVPLHVVELPANCGIGVAVQTGYLFALKRGGYQYVIQFDADGQHDADAIELLVNECKEKDLDFCVGSRFLSDDQDGFRSTAMRRVGISFLSGLISILSRSRITDPTSGFRCAGPRAWKAFARRYADDYPEPESLYWCIRNRLKVGEVPVTMFERDGGRSSIHSLRPLYYMVKVTLAILVDRFRAREFTAYER